jgi:hypothetical protein
MLVEAAYQVLSEDAEKIGFTYSGFALTSLPHKPQINDTWRREGHNLTLVLQSGVDRAGNSLGLLRWTRKTGQVAKRDSGP